MPATIGAYLANKNKNVICTIGDGSMQMNIQELATISHFNFPIKIFVINNNGYGLIKQTQDTWLNSRRVGVDSGSGLAMPNLVKIANAYGIKTVEINEQVEKTLGAFSALNAKINTVLSQKKFEDAIGISPKSIGLDTTKMDRVSKKTVAAFDKKLKTKKAPKKKTKIDKNPLLDYKNTKRKNSFKKVKINN